MLNEGIELSGVWCGELEGKCLADAGDDSEDEDDVQRMCLVGDRASGDAPDDAGGFKLAVLIARGHCARATSSIKSGSAPVTGESALLRCNEARLCHMN